MTRVISLDALVPEDVRVSYQGKTYVFSGDPPLDVLTGLVEALTKAQEC